MPEQVIRHEFTVAPAETGARLDAVLAGRLQSEGLSREKVKKLIKEGRAELNGRVCDSPKAEVRAGDGLALERPAEAAAIAPEAGEVTVVHRDKELAVLDKPAGLAVHPCPNRPDGTLAHRLVAHFPELAAMEGFRPGIVHRLDKDTSGLLVVALSEKSRQALNALFAGREIFKEYLALTHGVPPQAEETIATPIGRHPTQKTRMAVSKAGKPAKSLRRTLYADPAGRFSVQAVRIFTGRTHQIRVHLAHIGHPIIGDLLYGGAHPAAMRQMLHAHRLAFLPPSADPQAAPLRFVCPPPQDFLNCLRQLAHRPLRVALTGSPGCGKSTLLRALGRLDLPTASADALVAELYGPGRAGHLALRSRYGARFVPDPAGPVDKKALTKALLADNRLRREVEELIHPLVDLEMEAFCDRHIPDGLVILEIPLYFEAGFHETPKNTVSVGVHRPFALRCKDLMEKRGWSKRLVERMESWQWPEADKMRACDLVLDNSGSLPELEAKAGELARTLMERACRADAERLENIRKTWENRPWTGLDEALEKHSLP